MTRKSIIIKPRVWSDREDDEIKSKKGIAMAFRSWRELSDSVTAEISNEFQITLDIQTAKKMKNLLEESLDSFEDADKDLEEKEMTYEDRIEYHD